MGSVAFEAQYQQRPVPPGGNMIKWKWFRTYDRSAFRSRGKGKIVQSWDTASKTGEFNDYTVCTTWFMRDNEYYLIDVLRKRIEYPDQADEVEENAKKYGQPTVLIEDSFGGVHLIQDLKRRRVVRPIAVAPRGTKEERMAVHTPIIETGRVLLPAAAPWLEEFKLEVMAFPNCAHDDQIDSMSQFFTWLEERIYRRATVRDF